MTLPNRAPELQLREEFNRWAEAGRGEEMEDSHLPIVVPMLKLMEYYGLFEPLREFGRERPVFGTCAGAILLAKEVLNPPQEKLGLIDITIERNAYGRQIDSSIQTGDCPDLSDHPVEMVFRRNRTDGWKIASQKATAEGPPCGAPWRPSRPLHFRRSLRRGSSDG